MNTPFSRPANELPDTWVHGAAIDTSLKPDMNRELQEMLGHDSHLRELLTVVMSSNHDFAAAALKVRKANLQAGLAENAMWPQPSVGTSTERRRSLRSGGPTSQSHSATASVAYEVDLWNKLGTERDMATWEAHATAEDRRNVRITLLATAGSLYFRLGLLNDRIRTSAANLQNARRVLELVQAQYTYGAASALEVAEARQVVQSQEAIAAQLSQQHVETRNALGVLVDGRDLSAYEQERLPGYAVPQMPAGLPVALLSQRPDIRAAELRLRRSQAAVDVARASFYPTFTLTLSGGATSEELQRVLSNPIGTLAGSLVLPFVNMRKARLTTEIARTEFDEAVLIFQQSLLSAFAEVDNALSASVQLAREGAHLEGALSDARIVEHLYEARYREGAVALRDWLNAQDRRRQAETALMENRYARFANAITALKTLGVSLEIPAEPNPQNRT